MSAAERFERALAVAVRFHSGQRDLAGEPYALHLLRVALAQKDALSTKVGLLHDILEDTPATPAFLVHLGIEEEVVKLVQILTKREGEDYLGGYIPRVARNKVTRRVKMDDLLDNLNLLRLPSLEGTKWASRARKYVAAYRYLSEVEAETKTTYEEMMEEDPKGLARAGLALEVSEALLGTLWGTNIEIGALAEFADKLTVGELADIALGLGHRVLVRLEKI